LDSALLITIVVGIALLVAIIVFLEVNSKKSVFSRKKAEALAELESLKIRLKSGEVNETLCVVQADTIFDKAFSIKTGSTANFGEKLKLYKHLFRKEMYNNIWEAHKIRNKVVHENYTLNKEDATNVINIFKKALYDL
jgi:hypothetical protein